MTWETVDILVVQVTVAELVEAVTDDLVILGAVVFPVGWKLA